ncbi:MAG: homocysteine S-methyltransferase family protein [Streptosporangiaceae bacterium]|nr:homocysteine S-methyltransferase family protein [Streptosporangiaceae bacterium]
MNGLIRLDGGVATELMRAGMSLTEPWWSTVALNTEPNRVILRDVHERYLAAGAQVITANTFRCNARTLRRLGLDGAGHAWMVHAAIGVAMAARGGSDARVAASMAPVEDCFRPDLVPSDEELRAEHRWLATEISRSGVGLVLIETMNTSREARIALEAAQAAGCQGWVSFVCDAEGRVLSGERLGPVAKAAVHDGAEAVLVNCTSPDGTERALGELRESCSGPIGCYPNLEDRGDLPPGAPSGRYLAPVMSPEEFADVAARWRREYAIDILGGCCGTTPEHMRAAYSQTVGDGVDS